MIHNARPFIFAVILSACLSLFAQATANSRDENAAMENYAASLGVTKNLHKRAGTLSDGTKGLMLVSPGLDESTTLLDVGTSRETAKLHDSYCAAAAIVIAKEEWSTPKITQNKALIYARHEFVVSLILKSSPGLAAGSHIDVAQIGGNLVDAGEKIGVQLLGALPYVMGQNYLLILAHRADMPQGFYVPLRESETIQVMSNRLILPSGANDREEVKMFVNGETIFEARDSFKSAFEKYPCGR